MSAQKAPDKRIRRYLEWYSKRLNGQSEDQIRQDFKGRGLGEFGSSRALYLQLANDGFPVCKVCGETPVHPEHCESPEGRGVAPLEDEHAVKLPPAGAARHLFHESHQNLDLYVGLVEVEEEWLYEGKRFVRAMVDRDAYDVIERGGLSETRWRELCEQHGEDPEYNSFKVPVFEAGPEGIRRTPSKWLTALVAAYALTGKAPEPLLKALHPKPVSGTGEQVRKKVRELEKIAGPLAALVRGAKVGRGAPIEELSPREHLFAWLIHNLEQEGVTSNEELCERLKSVYLYLAEELTPDDVSRLRSRGLKPPE